MSKNGRITIKEIAKQGLFVLHNAGDPVFDAVAADQVVDLDWPFLANPINSTDALLQYGRIPGQL